MYLLYNLVFPVLFLCYLPFYLVHIIRRGGLTREYWQRFGFFGREIKERIAGLENRVWIHAVSVGESIAAITFIKAWQKRHPEDSIIFSCSTSTAYATMQKKKLPGVTLIYCPIDFWWAILHVLHIIRPHILAIFEVEIWPNLIRMAARRGVHVALVNGRMSDKSSAGYAKWGCFFRPIFNAFSTICVQTQDDAARVERVIGKSPKIHVCDTMKFDQVPDVSTANVTPVLDSAFGTAPRLNFVIGSTHPGEEEIICNAFNTLKKEFQNLKMILVPRHTERTAEVEQILKAKSLTWRLLKTEEGNVQTPAPVDVLLVNTTGELMNFFSAADVAFVGKSLPGQEGGHNIIEPAIFGKAIIYGEHMENFRAVAEIFRQRQAALEVKDSEDFTDALRKLLADPQLRQKLGDNAKATVDRYRGAIDRTLDAIG